MPDLIVEIGRCEMKKSILMAAIALVSAVVLASPDGMAQRAQSAEVLLGTALHQEEVEGDLEAAIETYKRILAAFPDNRPIAAQALLHMGRCYERLGQGEARKAYERLVREYADQAEAAAQARTRLTALNKPAPVSREPALSIRKVWTAPDMGNVEGCPSPDGRSLSFTDWETGDLAVVDLETGARRRLTNKGGWEESEEFAMFSRWSPDGRRIAYDWWDGRSMDLRVVSAQGGPPRTLLDNKNEEWSQVYDWSPDSRHILIFLEDETGQGRIARIAASDGWVEVVKTFEGPARFSHTMRFSPDGRHIAYDRREEERAAECDIFLIPAGGGPEVALVDHPAHDQLIGWSPGGEGILFASDRSGSLDVWFLAVSSGRPGGAPAFVKGGVDEIVPLGVTENGSFYYAQGRTMLDIYLATMDRQSGKVLERPEKAVQRFEGLNSWPEFSPDGRFLAYVSSYSRAFQGSLKPNLVCIRSLETGQERVFTTTFNRLAGTRWSPDGRSLYLAAWDDQGMGIYWTDAQTGDMTMVVRADGPQRIRSHDVSADGRTLVFVRQTGPPPEGSLRIVSRDLATGEEKDLFTHEAGGQRSVIALSPDGERLAFVNLDEKRAIRVMPATGGPSRDVLAYEDNGTFTPLEWSADGKSIFFLKSMPRKQASLWRVSAEGGEAQELGLTMANVENLSAHPDGTRLAFTSTGPEIVTPSIWVMENFTPPASAAAAAPATMTARMLENPPADTPTGAVSPDGRFFSFWDWRTDDLAVRDLRTGQDRRLTDEGTAGREGVKVSQRAGISTWSADGKKIAHAWYLHEADLARSELRIVGIDGGKPRVLPLGDGIREIGSLAWSPDGESIAASVYPRTGPTKIILISPNGGTARTLAELEREIIATSLLFSPDSRHLAYDRLPDPQSPERDIYLMDIDSGEEAPLVRHPADDYLLGWSRDGRWLVFASDRGGALGLWIVGIAGAKAQGEPRLVKPGIDRILPLGLTRDGSLYYGVVRATEDIFAVDLDPATGKVAGTFRNAIGQYEGGNFTPCYSPDGKSLAYVSRRGNSPYPTNVGNALCIRSLETGEERVFYKELWRLGLRWVGGPRWSPDGRYITFAGSERISRLKAYRLDLRTGEIVCILSYGPDEQLTGAAYGPGGTHYFGRANVKEGSA
ncbi:MAG TPA: tetratricopeptide repeat protein, partial [Candidatus Aminicenantes bacterium]|nr:tetratricopeptide repeat protein [Candidatus Aminicenantes bacterium]